MFKARANSLSGNIWKMFRKGGGCNLKRNHCVCSNGKGMCTSICGLELWKRLGGWVVNQPPKRGEGLKQSTNNESCKYFERVNL